LKNNIFFYENHSSWSGYGDELAWAATWLYRATNDSQYKTDAEKLVTEFKLHGLPKQFSWDDKTAGLQVLLAKVTGEASYKSDVEKFTDYLRNEAPKTPKGMVYLDQWGPARHAGNAAFIALTVSSQISIRKLFTQTYVDLKGSRRRSQTRRKSCFW